MKRMKDGTVEEILEQMSHLIGEWTINYWHDHTAGLEVSVSGRRWYSDYGWFGMGKTVSEALHASVPIINKYLAECEKKDLERKRRDEVTEFNGKELL